MDGLLYYCLYEFALDMVFYCLYGVYRCVGYRRWIVPVYTTTVIFMIISLFLLLTYYLLWCRMYILIDEKENVNA